MSRQKVRVVVPCDCEEQAKEIEELLKKHQWISIIEKESTK